MTIAFAPPYATNSDTYGYTVRSGVRLERNAWLASDQFGSAIVRTSLPRPRATGLEWQAGWMSGAILMPASALRAWAAECAKKFGAKLPFAANSPAGAELIQIVAERCDISISAATVRLSKLRLVVEDSSPTPHLKEKRGISRGRQPLPQPLESRQQTQNRSLEPSIGGPLIHLTTSSVDPASPVQCS